VCIEYRAELETIVTFREVVGKAATKCRTIELTIWSSENRLDLNGTLTDIWRYLKRMSRGISGSPRHCRRKMTSRSSTSCFIAGFLLREPCYLGLTVPWWMCREGHVDH
jgi:hypothetical protein